MSLSAAVRAVAAAALLLALLQGPRATAEVAEKTQASTAAEQGLRQSQELISPSSPAPADDDDEIAALEAIRIALTEVADGSAYVWHRRQGRLGGSVQPTASFKDRAGRVCRHILVMLTSGDRVGRAEGIACRLGDGRWQLDG